MDRPRSEIKVTDKRIFTAEGEIREEFRQEITPADPVAAKTTEPSVETRAEKPAAMAEMNAAERKQSPGAEPPVGGARRSKSVADKALNPGTPLADFIEPLIAQAYMSLGMLSNPYEPKPKADAGAARQMIEILTMLKAKTAGNLTVDEDRSEERRVGKEC